MPLSPLPPQTHNGHSCEEELHGTFAAHPVQLRNSPSEALWDTVTRGCAGEYTCTLGPLSPGTPSTMCS